MTDGISLGVLLPTWQVAPLEPPRWLELLDFARATGTAGFDLLWVPDHIGHGFANGS